MKKEKKKTCNSLKDETYVEASSDSRLIPGGRDVPQWRELIFTCERIEDIFVKSYRQEPFVGKVDTYMTSSISMYSSKFNKYVFK